MKSVLFLALMLLFSFIFSGFSRETLPPLHNACRDGQDLTVRALITAGADVNVKDPAGWTPLMRAVNRSSADSYTVDYLIAAGADVNVKCNRGLSALRTATGRASGFGKINDPIVVALLAAGAYDHDLIIMTAFLLGVLMFIYFVYYFVGRFVRLPSSPFTYCRKWAICLLVIFVVIPLIMFVVGLIIEKYIVYIVIGGVLLLLGMASGSSSSTTSSSSSKDDAPESSGGLIRGEIDSAWGGSRVDYSDGSRIEVDKNHRIDDAIGPYFSVKNRETGETVDHISKTK